MLGVSQASLTAAPGDLMPSLDSAGSCTHKMDKHTQRHAHIQIVKNKYRRKALNMLGMVIPHSGSREGLISVGLRTA